MSTLKSLRLGDYKCFFFPVCAVICWPAWVFICKQTQSISVWFFSSSAFLFIFFFALTTRWTSKITWKLSLLFLKLRLLEAGVSSAFFRAKKSEPSCPDTLDVKLQIACYLSLLLFLEPRELQKNTQIVWSTFDVIRDKYCGRVWRRRGEELNVRETYYILFLTLYVAKLCLCVLKWV